MAPPVHLQPTADLAPRVLLPGDPGRALRLAQALLEAPRMFNHHRGLWGYTGAAPDGDPVTIQSTGMGGPSSAIVIAELADLGARRLVRVGTCGALAAGLELGDLLLAAEAICDDGTSRALGAGERVRPSAPLLDALARAGGAAPVTVVSTDLFYDSPADSVARWTAAGASAVEMECATLFTLAARRGVEAGAALIVSDRVAPEPARLDEEALHAAELRLGRLALAALSPASRPPRG